MIPDSPDFLDTRMPPAQRQFLPQPLPLDCQIVLEDPSGFTLRCRVNIGEGGKWVKGPTPVLRTTNAPKRKAQGRHRRAHHKAR